MINNSPYAIMTSRILESMVWTKDLTTPEWCRRNIYLGGMVTPYVGMMSFDRTPWIEEILLDWDKPWIEFYNIMASTQVGKTTIEFCCITKELDTESAVKFLRMVEDFEEDDDVQNVYHNLEMTNDLMNILENE